MLKTLVLFVWNEKQNFLITFVIFVRRTARPFHEAMIKQTARLKSYVRRFLPTETFMPQAGETRQ